MEILPSPKLDESGHDKDEKKAREMGMVNSKLKQMEILSVPLLDGW